MAAAILIMTMFETHHTWQSANPTLARRLHERDRSQTTESPRVLLPAHFQEVVDYLKQHGHEQSIPGHFEVDPLEHEEILMRDLEEAIVKNDQDTVKHLRRLILASSTHRREGRPKKSALVHVIEYIQELHKQQATIARFDVSDAQDMEEHFTQWKHLEDALRHDVSGDDLEEVVRTIEEAYRQSLTRARHFPIEKGRKRAAYTLSDLRVIRDRLYQNRLFPYMNKKTEERSASQ